MQVSQSFRSDEHNTLKYAQLVGDWNPLHTDETYTNQTDTFSEQPIVHGTHILGWFSTMLTELGYELDAEIVLLNMDVDFESPLPVGETATVVARLPEHESGLVAEPVEIDLDAQVVESDTVVASGTATVMLDTSVPLDGGAT